VKKSERGMARVRKQKQEGSGKMACVFQQSVSKKKKRVGMKNRENG